MQAKILRKQQIAKYRDELKQQRIAKAKGLPFKKVVKPADLKDSKAYINKVRVALDKKFKAAR